MNEVTIWLKWDTKRKLYMHNHLVDREPDGKDAPTPKSDIQRSAWKGAKWFREDGCLDTDGKVVI